MNTTSRAEKGAPSDHDTPGRRVKRSWRRSSLQACCRASQGTYWPMSGLWMSIGSYIARRVGQRTGPDSSRGLKFREKAAVCSVSSTVITPGGSFSRRGTQPGATTAAQAIKQTKLLALRSKLPGARAIDRTY